MRSPNVLRSAHRRSPTAMHAAASVLMAAMTVAVTGCKVGPNYTASDAATPASWNPSRPAAVTTTRSASTQPLFDTHAPSDMGAWWTILNDRTLDALVTQAINQNLDVKIAVERVNEARALRGIAKSELFPSVNAGGGYERTHVSRNTPIGGSLPTSSYDNWQGGFDANWELDFFGRVQRGVEAANADLDALNEARRDVLVRLLAETARNYVELRASQRRLAVATNTLKAQEDTLDLVKVRRAAGAVGDLDVSRAEADVRTTEAAIPPLQGDIEESIFSIAALLGVDAGSLYDELVVVQAIPISVSTVPIGLPSDLLRRRPDIRQAERQLAGATARIGVAVADYYPRFSLTGAFIMDASHLSHVGDWDSRQFGIGPSVTWNIFDAGRITNNVRFSEARQREALAQYQKVVVDSLREVETALTRYSKEFARRQSLADAVRSNEQSVSLAKEQYQAGSIDLLQVLDAQRNLFTSQDQLARSDQAISTQLIALYKGLGGGWEATEPALKAAGQ